MAISQQDKIDAYAAVDFTDNLKAATDQIRQMQAKIGRYGAGVAALQAGTADARETRFVQLVTLLIGAEDVQRIAALVPMINDWLDIVDNNYADFVSPH